MDAVRASFTSSSGGRRSIFAVMNGGSGKDMEGLQIQGAVIHPGYCTAVCRGQWIEASLTRLDIRYLVSGALEFCVASVTRQAK